MLIKHINNSFFQVSSDNLKIVCDPWIGRMEGTSTWSFPNIGSNKGILNKLKPKLIYISHLHSDHYDESVLRKYKNKDVKIIIKKFPDGRLKQKLKFLGYKNIVEIKPWKSYNFHNFEFTIIPSDESNTSGIKTKIFYDLDTSIIIYDKKNKICFYNNVDNPLSIKSIKKVQKIAKKKYNGIDVACVGPRAASEYPQCFLKINRKKEKKRIIKKTFDRAFKILKILKVKNFIPAGGAFHITGKFSPLQKYVAHPKEKEIELYFKSKKINVLNIDNCGEIKITKNKKFLYSKKSKSITEKDIKYLKSLKSDHEKVKVNLNLSKIFNKAKKRYLFFKNKFKLNFSYQIKFFAYKSLKINKNGNIVKKKYKVFELFPNAKTVKYLLEVHIDERLLYLCLINKSNWNMSMGGSNMMFFRKPNKFIPDISSSLNFLRAK